MTLLWMDGFDNGDEALRYPVSSGVGGGTPGRLSYGRYTGIRSNALLTTNFTASSTIVVGHAININGVTYNVSLWGDAGVTQHLTLVIGADGSLNLRRGTSGGTSIATAAAGTVATSGYTYVEIKATISDTVGICEIRINGSSTPIINFSGDTKNAGTATTIDQIRFAGGNSATSNFVDDLYILNGLGSTNNDFLGDVRVLTLVPSGNGNYSQFVGSDADSVNNYLLVDEQPYSSVDYVGSATSGNRDTYTMTDLPAGASTVYAVQEVSIVAKSDAGASSIKQALRISSTDYETAAFALSTSYTTLLNLRETNPNTSAAWTVSDVNGIEAGVRVG